MHLTAVVLLHDDDLARDIVHDVFASLLEGSLEMTESEAYLIRAVRNRCLNHLRDSGTRERVRNLLFLDNEEYDAEEWPDEETIARIRSLIETDLTPQARRVVELRFSSGMKFAGIAAEMGISETAVYRHLRHALEVLRLKLSDNG